MENKLSKIEKDITANENRQAQLKTQLESLENSLQKKDNEYQSQILAGKGTEPIENDILVFTIKRDGTLKALQTLAGQMEALQKALAAEKRAIFLAKAEAGKGEVLRLAQEFHARAAVTVEAMDAMQEKYAEYVRILKSENSLDLHDKKVHQLVNYILGEHGINFRFFFKNLNIDKIAKP